MHDMKMIRDNPEQFDAALIRRGAQPVAQSLVALDAERRKVATEMQHAQARRNEASKLIGKAMAAKDQTTANTLKDEVATLKTSLSALEEQGRQADEALNLRLAELPNLPADDVPDGADESENVEIARWGTPRTFDFPPKEHADIGPALGLDFETGAKLSGARFTFMRGGMARLNRALGQYMLDKQIAAGFVECATPYLVREEAVFGVGQLPKFSEDLFKTTDGRWLISTSEVSLTNSVREQILDANDLPMRLTALTPCFRSEAGAAGRDTRGLIRQHQFEKIEMVTIAHPDDSEAQHAHMVASAEAVLQDLDLPYRKVILCTGDMGQASRKTFDLEVWLPGQNAYREISSISNCGDYQARRMAARFRPEGETKGTEYVHTLNGSGLAVGRTLVAIIENYQRADGSLRIPDALRSYMGGVDTLEPTP